jgi:flagellar hook-associated protein 2
VKAGLDAFASIRSRTSAVRSAATELASPNSWRALAATTSNPTAVAVSAGTGAGGGSLTFTVEALAAAMQRSSADTFSGLDAALGDRTISITIDGQTHDFDSAGTLGELVDQINEAGIGVKASTLQVTSGEHRLILTSTATGLDNAFTVDESPEWGSPFAVTRAAADAQLDVGGITVTRSSNTIDDLLAGATITLKETTTQPVTVGVARDVEGISNKVKALVDAMNGALNEIKLRTDYDAETNRRSSLTGDATARTLAQSLTRALSNGVSQSNLGSVGLAGVSMTREGRFEFDAVAFASAYESDPAAVERLFVAGAETSEHITFSSAGWRATPGQHDIELRNIDGVWSGRIGGQDATVTVNDDGSLRLNVASTNESMGGMTIQVASDALAGVGAEYAVVGTIDYEPGAARRLTTATNRALDAVDGSLTTAEQTRENTVKDINRQIEAWEIRLDKRELRLRQQYTALESMLGQLQNQGQWLSGQISQLTANNNVRR